MSTQNYITLRPHALVLTTDRDIIHVMCKSAANFLLLFMSHLLLAWVMNVPEQPFSYNSKELANMSESEMESLARVFSFSPSLMSVGT